MVNSQQNKPGDASSGPGSAGPFTGEAGMLGYNEICKDLSSWTVKWDNFALVSYAYKDSQWLSYDDHLSLKYKINLVNYFQLAGTMLWSIDTDDFGGKCGQVYPLLNTVKRLIDYGESTSRGSVIGCVLSVLDCAK